MSQVMSRDIGWGKACKEILTKHNLPTDIQTIKNMNKNEWTKKVDKAIEKYNKERLLEDLHKTEGGIRTRKKKTAFIVDCIERNDYNRKPLPELMYYSKRETKVIITARFSMLECGKNFKGTQSETCNVCNVKDDEDHRLNHCTKYRNINLCDDTEKVDFREI